MSYSITLTNNSDIGNNTQFTNRLADPILVRPNSYFQLNSAYIRKANGFTDPDGVYIYIPQFSNANTYSCNTNNNSCRNGLVGCVNGFLGVGPSIDDIINFNNNSPKIP